MAAAYFVLATLLATAGAISLALALRTAKLRAATAPFLRFPRVRLDALTAGTSGLVYGAVKVAARSLEVPHTLERAVWVRYRMEELGREYTCLLEDVEQVPFVLADVAGNDAADGDAMPTVRVDLSGATVRLREPVAAQVSELFDDVLPEFATPLPEQFQDAVLARMAEKPGLYRLVIDRVAVGDKLWISGAARGGGLGRGVEFAQQDAAPLWASNEPERSVTAYPSAWRLPVGLALGAGLLAAAVRVFVFAGAVSAN